MVCNGVKYYPEKDADSYYARPRSESFNPMTSPSLFLFSYPHTCRKMLTCHFHCQSVTRGIQRERSSAERGLRKRGIYSSPSPFSSSSLEINLVFFLSFFFPQSLPLLIYIDVALARDHKLHNRGAIWIYKFATGMIIRDDRTEGWESVSFFYIL